MEKRVRFTSKWLPWLLITPQMLIVLVFFFWPAGQALYQSVLTEDIFGGNTVFVGLENFERLFADESYLASFRTTAVFSLLVAFCGLALSLLLAVMANRVLRGSGIYRTLLVGSIVATSYRNEGLFRAGERIQGTSDFFRGSFLQGGQAGEISSAAVG